MDWILCAALALCVQNNQPEPINNDGAMNINPLDISTKSKVECVGRITLEKLNISDLNDEFVNAVLYCAKWLDKKNKREGGN